MAPVPNKLRLIDEQIPHLADAAKLTPALEAAEKVVLQVKKLKDEVFAFNNPSLIEMLDEIVADATATQRHVDDTKGLLDSIKSLFLEKEPVGMIETICQFYDKAKSALETLRKRTRTKPTPKPKPAASPKASKSPTPSQPDMMSFRLDEPPEPTASTAAAEAPPPKRASLTVPDATQGPPPLSRGASRVAPRFTVGKMDRAISRNNADGFRKAQLMKKKSRAVMAAPK
eukprot:c18613_g1_i2.p1 GENE.c18613_g1_i2~~c18613_g1_i2.p1  ORF type:complete len:229 (-),score=55.47 c18613_g1_i2:24-710(-)